MTLQIILFRTIMVIVIVPFLLWAFFSTLVKEIASAFYFAWLEVLSTLDEFRDGWKNTRKYVGAADRQRNK